MEKNSQSAKKKKRLFPPPFFSTFLLAVFTFCVTNFLFRCGGTTRKLKQTIGAFDQAARRTKEESETPPVNLFCHRFGDKKDTVRWLYLRSKESKGRPSKELPSKRLTSIHVKISPPVLLLFLVGVYVPLSCWPSHHPPQVAA